jgi:hypothetical protein
MKRFSTVRLFAIPATLALGMCGLVSCDEPASTNGIRSAMSAPATVQLGSWPGTGAPRRDLARDEAEGGHTLRKHAGQSEQQLRQRLERAGSITGASSYTDRSTAEDVVSSAIENSDGQIQNWLSRPGRHPNLVLDYDGEVWIGRTINRGENQPRACKHAIVVLKYNGPNDYYVLTSYPEC